MHTHPRFLHLKVAIQEHKDAFRELPITVKSVAKEETPERLYIAISYLETRVIAVLIASSSSRELSALFYYIEIIQTPWRQTVRMTICRIRQLTTMNFSQRDSFRRTHLFDLFPRDFSIFKLSIIQRRATNLDANRLIRGDSRSFISSQRKTDRRITNANTTNFAQIIISFKYGE